MWDFCCLEKALGIAPPFCGGGLCTSSLNMWTEVAAWEAVKMPFIFLFGSLLALIVVTFLLNWSRRNFGGG